MAQGLDSELPLHRAWVPSLVGELRSHMLLDVAKIKQNNKINLRNSQIEEIHRARYVGGGENIPHPL